MGHFMRFPEISAVSLKCNTDRIVSAFASQCVQNTVFLSITKCSCVIYRRLSLSRGFRGTPEKHT